MDNNGWWNLGRNALIRKDTESREPRKSAVSWGLLGNRGVCVWGGGGLPDWGPSKHFQMDSVICWGVVVEEEEEEEVVVFGWGNRLRTLRRAGR